MVTHRQRLYSILIFVFMLISTYRLDSQFAFRDISKVKASLTLTKKESAAAIISCKPVNKELPLIFLSKDEFWQDSESVRLVLHNNSDCSIDLMSNGKQMLKEKGKIIFREADELENESQTVIAYQYIDRASPNLFNGANNLPHTAYISHLAGGRKVKFLVLAKHLSNKGQVIISFNYSWERQVDRTTSKHIVISPSDFLDKK